MMTPRCRKADRIGAGAAMLLFIAAASLTVGCATSGRSWSRVPQLTTSASRTGVIPGAWDRVDAVQPGSPLVVTLKSGDRIEGAFKALRPGMLALTDPAGRETSVPRSEVGKIVARGVKDRLRNGALTGAGVGLGAALAVLAVVGSRDGYVLPSARWGAPLLLSSVGGVVGALVDRAHKGDELLYVATTPAYRDPLRTNLRRPIRHRQPLQRPIALRFASIRLFAIDLGIGRESRSRP